MARRNQEFQTLRSEGGLLPPDLLRRVIDPKSTLKGVRAEDYGLPQGERINEVVTQAWNRLRKHWAEFRAALGGVPAGDAATGITNDKWTLPLLRELGFGLLPTSAGPEIAGRHYAINRFFGPVPLHLVGAGVTLDRRAAGVRGAAVTNPHGLVQEFLNRSQGHLWAIVSNGLQFRVLRDNQALSRQAFLEFDLEAMFAGEVYADFVLLWLTAHATRFAPRDAEGAESCWLELWTKEADDQGTRALGDLRTGVQKALEVLGTGFCGHQKNVALRESLRTGGVTPAELHGQLLRIVYRLILLFVAEDRTIDGEPLLHPRDESELAVRARRRYADHYSTERLRSLAGQIKGSRHGDLWCQFQIISRALSTDEGSAPVREHLALPVLGSFLWDPESTAALNQAELTNFDFLDALRNLAFTRQGKTLRPVDYRNLGAEELGGVYESLLALTPQVSPDGSGFTFAELAGNQRKTSGSYYTPDSLVQCLLDSALDPVVDEALRGKSGADAEHALLALKVCDPAVGSGHFLVGAAHRLARHLARMRAIAQGESEPSPLLYQHALRDVIGRCLYGVDLNPMAAELCRVSLWLEALDPGKPLSFIDHHIRVGNSLLGATPELIAAGLPDEAFTAIQGDDNRACAVLKKRNKVERKGLGPLFDEEHAEAQSRLQSAAAALDELPDDHPEDVRVKEQAYRRHRVTEAFTEKWRLADAWCAAFVFRKSFREPGRELTANGITQSSLNAISQGLRLPEDVEAAIHQLAGQYRFFHWHLAYPEVFVRGGFDCVLGNPPWDRVKLQEKEWFATRRAEITMAANAAARRQLIRHLADQDPSLWQDWQDAQRSTEGASHFFRASGRFPYCGVGRDINEAAVFAEFMWAQIGPRGRVGCIVPSAICTDDTTKDFYKAITSRRALISLFDFENQKVFFPEVDSRYKFCLLSIAGKGSVSNAGTEYAFFLTNVADLHSPEKRYRLPSNSAELLSPNTGTAVVLRSQLDAALALAIYRRVPVLSRDGHRSSDQWPVQTRPGHFHMSNDAEMFFPDRAPLGQERALSLPLYEAKMVHQFEHRWASAVGDDIEAKEREDPLVRVRPRYRVAREHVIGRRRHENARWHLVVRDIARSTDERTMIAAIVPECGVGGTLMLLEGPSPTQACELLACLNSFCADYLARQRVAGVHLNPSVFKQIPVPPPSAFDACYGWTGTVTFGPWVRPRVLELCYTSWDLEPFSRAYGCNEPPYAWNEERRFLMRCELDAAFFRLYLKATPGGDWCESNGETSEDLASLKAAVPTPRDAVSHIMDTFSITRRKDEERHGGDYRTKRVILECYDSMQEAARTGQAYQTRLEPPPADPRCCHPPLEG